MPRYGSKSVETWLKIYGFDDIRVKHVGKLMVLIIIHVWYPGLVWFCRVEVYPRVETLGVVLFFRLLELVDYWWSIEDVGSSFLLFDRLLMVKVNHGFEWFLGRPPMWVMWFDSSMLS